MEKMEIDVTLTYYKNKAAFCHHIKLLRVEVYVKRHNVEKVVVPYAQLSGLRRTRKQGY